MQSRSGSAGAMLEHCSRARYPRKASCMLRCSEVWPTCTHMAFCWERRPASLLGARAIVLLEGDYVLADVPLVVALVCGPARLAWTADCTARAFDRFSLLYALERGASVFLAPYGGDEEQRHAMLADSEFAELQTRFPRLTLDCSHVDFLSVNIRFTAWEGSRAEAFWASVARPSTACRNVTGSAPLNPFVGLKSERRPRGPILDRRSADRR